MLALSLDYALLSEETVTLKQDFYLVQRGDVYCKQMMHRKSAGWCRPSPDNTPATLGLTYLYHHSWCDVATGAFWDPARQTDGMATL